jgi:hypothetical protein
MQGGKRREGRIEKGIETSQGGGGVLEEGCELLLFRSRALDPS